MSSQGLTSDIGALLIEDVLGKLRSLGAHWQEAADAIEVAVAAKGKGEPSLCLSASGRWFRIGDGATITLARRRAPWRILSHLAHSRLMHPGEGIPLDELVSVGWPKEQIQARAAASRVYFVIRELRLAGLRDALMTSGDGYLIDTRYAIFWA
jgi:hypothetical protein